MYVVYILYMLYMLQRKFCLCYGGAETKNYSLININTK